MTYFNPLAGSVLGSAGAQQQLAADNTCRVRRSQTLTRNSAAATDRLDHEVESLEAPSPVHDQPPDERPPRRRPRRQPTRAEPDAGTGELSRLDVTG